MAHDGQPRMTRWFWIVLGATSLGLGVLGALLPLLPTTPFLLLSAFAFARSSPAIHRWLLQHRLLGKPIRDWNERRAISTKGKFASLAAMGTSLGASVVLELGLAVIAVQAAVLAGVAAFILTRSSA